jgi:hypothetical protein
MIPTELRLKIYGYALISEEAIIINRTDPSKLKPNSWSFGPGDKKSSNAKILDVDLLLTCKFIDNEAATILYRKNEFLIISWERHRSTSSCWLCTLRPSTVNLINELSYVYPDCQICSKERLPFDLTPEPLTFFLSHVHEVCFERKLFPPSQKQLNIEVSKKTPTQQIL